ncbi:amylo-alpha-1,6-glucosidase [Clostridium paraputrificum]|uniref:amylo-alpha-1,6-glucosidase n=1 Tax=Clostridium paraputrificum TaxID=29363 RepID=UPI000669A77D|nr:trehalase family glycosidase [Clostridium paraputrificum]MDB2105910.1 trehalase family glycosidase [Clostridium paraputrificum]MDB2112785.1 trehalase family glycosidase [Clostridium paraputrificum]
MNLIDVPFSAYGSYMSVYYYCKEKSHIMYEKNLNNGLYIKSLRGKSRSNAEVVQLNPLVNGNLVEYEYEADYSKIDMKFNEGKISLCFDGDSRILIKGTGKNIGLRLDCMPVSKYDYNFELQDSNGLYCIINSYKSLTKYIVKSIKGNLNLFQEFNSSMLGSLSSYIDITSDEDEEFLLLFEEVPTHMNKPTEKNYIFEESLKNMENEFNIFYEKFPRVPEEFKETLKLAAYVDWSCVCKKDGLLGRDTMSMANNVFPGIWSWDHCFNALALAGSHNELAWDQMMIIFDHQDKYGQLPGSVSDSTIRWNFAKPPIHGLFIEKMMERMEFSESQLIEAYECLEKQISFWLNYKDMNNDGICEYHHGNDSGYDNSTVFLKGFIVDSPDLSVYIIKAMDTLALISEKLGKDSDKAEWKRRADELTEKTIRYFIKDGLPIAHDVISNEIIYSESILPYTILLLGNRLPKDVQKNIINILKTKHLTEYGLSTEALDSKYYESDGYWRGPIWAPTTVIIIYGLEECGEKEFADELKLRFCKLIKKGGCAENFDAITGEGLCDRAHTWTSSSFIYLSGLLK